MLRGALAGSHTAESASVLAFLSGVLAGCLHVLSGPDHMAAVAPLAVGEARAGGRLGASWGMGHGGGVLLWLGAAWLFGDLLPIQRVSDVAEMIVGLSLVVLGLFTLLSRARRREHRHPHEHGTAFGMGVLHGTAGAGHFLVVLPTLGLPQSGVVLYATGYLLSAVAVMATAGTLLSRLGALTTQAGRLRAGFAVCTIAVGLFWLGTSTLG